jgi:hypothetical protein
MAVLPNLWFVNPYWGFTKSSRALKQKVLKKQNKRKQSINTVSVAPGPACYIQNSCHQILSGVGMPCVTIRKCDDEYIKFRFTYTGDQD